MGWRDRLLHLHSRGWNADDIDDACEALRNACDEGEYDGAEIRDLTSAQLRSVLQADMDEGVLISLREIATLRCLQSTDAEELQRALYDLDAFAYRVAGDD